MKRMHLVVLAAVALCTTWTLGAGVAGACDSKATGASMSMSCCAKGQTASAGGACGAKAGLTAIFKEAPGTKTEWVHVDNGVALVVTASDPKYVPVVQTAMMHQIDQMKSMAGATCPYSGAKMSGTCPHADKTSAAAGTCTHGDKAMAASGTCAHGDKVQAGATCPMKGNVSSASVTECPEWMKVFCGANMTCENTPTGIKVTWTSSKPEGVDALRTASTQFTAELVGKS